MAALTRIETLPATITEAEIAANLSRHAETASGAYAANTTRALRADVAIFTGWCGQQGHPSLPASPATVAAFVDAMAGSKAPATVRRYVSSIATFHRAAELANPCEALAVKLRLKAMHNAKGRAQQQAAPISDRTVERMLQAASRPTLRNLRNRALLTVACVTMCRRSDLVALQLADLQVEPDGFGTVVIRRSKTDQEGTGAVAPITADAMRHVLAWVAAAAITDGPLFRAIRKGPRVRGAMGGNDVALAFKAMAGAARLSPEEIARISGHSTRVGAAQDLLRFGEQLPSIMQAGRWKSPQMVARYTAKQASRDGAAARIAHRRVPF